MKTALLLMIASCMSISCDAEVIVYRNGADGSFLWGARPVVCWQTYQKWLDISLPLSQAGTRSARTLEWERGCFYGLGCEPNATSILRASGTQVQIAGGDTVSYSNQCYPTVYTISIPKRLFYGATIDENMIWEIDPLAIELIGRGSFYLTGRFVGIRVQLSDGWHYGWVILTAYAGWGQPDTAYGEIRPAAYALESQPNTAVITPSCRLDLNYDGTVDFEDYLAFVEYFVRGDERARWSPYTQNDYEIDFFDYLDFVSDFSTGC